MQKSRLRDTLFELIEPAIRSFAYRLVLLSHGRPGSRKSKLDVKTLFETGIVTSIYEHMLMAPAFRDYEVRREDDLENVALKKRRSKQVDLWLRHIDGGPDHMIEVGDFSPGKVRADLRKVFEAKPTAHHIFIALFRDDPNEAKYPFEALCKSACNKRGLDWAVVSFGKHYCRTFELYTAPDRVENFGYALMILKKG